IFGASGDLTQRKLIPALFDLFEDGLLSRNFAVLGFGRTALSDAQFREGLHAGVQQFSRHAPLSAPDWTRFSPALHYQPGHFGDPASYREIDAHLAEIDVTHGTQGNRVFYLATPPELFP